MIRRTLTHTSTKFVYAAGLVACFIGGYAAIITKIDQWGHNHTHPVLQAFTVGCLVGMALVVVIGFVRFFILWIDNKL